MDISMVKFDYHNVKVLTRHLMHTWKIAVTIPFYLFDVTLGIWV